MQLEPQPERGEHAEDQVELDGGLAGLEVDDEAAAGAAREREVVLGRPQLAWIGSDRAGLAREDCR